MNFKFNTEYKENLKNIKRKSRIETATDSAQHIHKSLYGETIVEKNPFEDKQLQSKIKKLEQKKKALEQNYFWCQRQFFIEKAFDENNELKFTKLNANMMKESKKFKLPSISSAQSAPNPSDGRPKKLQLKRSLTENIFPVNPSLNLPAISMNYKRLKDTEQRHKQTLDKAQTALDLFDDNLSRKQSGRKADDTNSRNGSARGNPILLPIMSKPQKEIENSNKKDLICEKRNTVLKKMKDKNGTKMSKDECLEGELSSSSQYIEPNDTEFDVKEDEFFKPLEKIRQDKSDTSGINMESELVKNKHNFVDVLREASRSFETLTISRSVISLENHPIKSKSLVSGYGTPGTLKSDELLVKLTKSLPMHLLIKTDETLADLSSVLGYVERNKALAAKEKTIASQVCVFDERFQNLLSALNSQGKNESIGQFNS